MRNTAPKRQRKNDDFLKLTVLQLAVCALLFAVIFLAMKTNGSLFARLKAEFSALTAKDCNLNEITFFPFSGEEDAAVSAAQAEPEDTQAENEARDEAQAADAPVNETKGEPPTTDAAAGETGTGGEDITGVRELKLVSFRCYAVGDTPVLPVAGRVTSEFGERVHPIYGTVSFHSGKDLAAPEGTPIYAALDGEVESAGIGEMSGNYVKLRHAGGLETLYCHCSRLNVEAGVKVRKGDVIAFVGQTGLATGPHLHFEVHIDGVKHDPDYLLEGAVRVV